MTKPSFRKADKFLLLLLWALVFFHANLNAASGVESSHRSVSQDTIPPQRPDTSAPSPLRQQIDTNSSGVVIIQPAQGRLFVVGDIAISGNKKTKAFVITRELSFKTGDSITLQQLTRYFTQGREHLVNTHLFNDVTIYLKQFRGYTVDVSIDVKERWYIFPLPYARPVDRNFTAWAQQGYSLSRFDYGVKYSQYNFTGRNDNLRLWLVTGYSKQVEMAYDRPNNGKNQVHGFGGSFLYSVKPEINMITQDNQQVFVSRDTIAGAGKYLQKQAVISLRYYYRPAIRTRHFFRISLNNLSIDSAVLVYNPNYLLNHQLSLTYPELFYSLNYNNIDYVPYPTRGFLFETSLLQRGFSANMNMTQLIARTSEAIQFAPKMYFVSQNYGVLRVPFKQSFYNQSLLGYGDFYMRGLERYVVDGVGMLLDRNTIMRELLHFDIPFLRKTSHDHIPFRIYAKIYSDVGYVFNKYNNQNSLQNTFLYTYGAGFDAVTFYDLVLRLEYSINQLGEKGLFFHIRNDF